MKQTQNSFPWLGILLIVLGTILLLQKTNVIDINFIQIVWPILSFVGFSIAMRGFSQNRNSTVFGGSFIFLISIFFFIRSINLYEVETNFFPSVISLIIGFSFLLTYLNSLKEYILLILAMCFLTFGVVFLLIELNYFDSWDTKYIIKTYWPIILIIIGFKKLLRIKESNKTN